MSTWKNAIAAAVVAFLTASSPSLAGDYARSMEAYHGPVFNSPLGFNGVAVDRMYTGSTRADTVQTPTAPQERSDFGRSPRGPVADHLY